MLMVINLLSPVIMTICWVLLLMFFTCLDGTCSTCVFDAIKSSDVAVTQVNYTLRRDPGFAEDARLRRKRDISIDDFFRPIRLSTFFFKMELDDSEREKLKSVINRAVSLIKKMLSVLPVEGPLLLNRTGCRSTLVEGINEGKCFAAVKNYRGEFCSDLQIPNDHLDEFSLWSNTTGLEPTSVPYKRGDGVNNTDFILYVQSFASSQCTAGELNIIAYATYCRLDQNGRPVAGYINICPEMMRQNDFNDEKIFLTVLHELFHALGFSYDLFNSFKECSLTGNFSISCRPLQRTVRSVRGAQRLVTNRVVEFTSKHFSCNSSGSDFGPILQTDGSDVKSHWDAAFMQSSLMTPTISQPHMTFLDPITLAVFEDSGWYRVNYTYRQEYYWGKGQGCDFGLSSSCLMPDSAYFCQQQSSRGCHFLHKDRGTCLSSPFLHGCNIYESHLKDSCNRPLGFSTDSDGFGESFGETSRCFLSNLTQVTGDELASSTADLDLVGRCYDYSCNATGHVYVKVEDKWIHCPKGVFIEVPDLNGVVKCPASEILCSNFRSLFNISMEGTSDGIPITRDRFTTPHYCENLLAVDITFESLPTFAQGSSQLAKMFHDVVISVVLSSTNISVGRIENMTVLWSQDSVWFALKKPVQNFIDDSSHFMEVLSRVVNAGNFSVSFSGSVYRATAVSYRQMSSHMTTPHHRESSTAVNPVLPSFLSHSGIILVITVVSIILVVILLVVVILVFRYCCLARRSKGPQNRPVDSVA